MWAADALITGGRPEQEAPIRASWLVAVLYLSMPESKGQPVEAETIPTIFTSRTTPVEARIQPSSFICHRVACLAQGASHTSIQITTITTSRTTTLTGTSTIRQLLFVPTTFSSTGSAIFSSITSYKEQELNILEREGHLTLFVITTRTMTMAA